jgi:signal transduction histidine kinase/ActR/RegA family two-component response regulator
LNAVADPPPQRTPAPGAGASAPVPRLLVLTGVLALLVVVTARLGLSMAIGSAGITPLWPPSGIALAALLLYGRRALPGIAVGAFAQYTIIAPDPGLLQSRAVLASVAALTGLALAQCAIGALALRGFAGRLREHPVQATLRFVAVAAAACAPSAVAGPFLLHMIMPSHMAEPLFTVLTWWVGDTTGMLVVAPPLLLALHPALRSERITVQAFPTICLGLGLTLFTTFTTGLQARDARFQRFDAETRRLAVALANHAEMAGRDLETLQHVFRRVPMDRDEFRAIAAPMLDRSPWQSTFGWLPRVTADERAHFEIASDGLDGASIRELAGDAALVRARPRPEYWPLAWTAPEFGREALIGVDNGADRWRGPALVHAREGGRLSVTPPLHTLANSTDERLVQVMYAPIEPADERGPAPRGARAVTGLVSATIDLERLLQAALAQRDVTGQQVLMFDAAAPEAALRWIDAQHVDVLDAAALRGALAHLEDGVYRRLDVPVADRDWVIVCRPEWAGTLTVIGLVQVGVFLGGLAFTALITGFLMVRRRRDEALQQARARLEDQVAARTSDLATSNERLRSEIDGHRRTEVLLQEASHRAESANRAKSLFLANMSHEIRTPLNAVLGYTQLLREDRRLPADSRERLQVIHAAGNRLLGLINDVLDLAKIEAGGLQLNEEPLDLRRELREVAALFEPRAEQKGLALAVDLDLDGTPVVRGDRAKLGQIVLNLLGNALKFTEQGRITLAAWRLGGQVVVEVADTGPGMSEAERETLFLPFRQGAAGLHKGGTGLGLALSRNLAQAMGGDLEVESAPGEGTRVRLTLPMADVDAVPATGATFSGRQRLDAATPCRALVVEDDLHSRDVLVELLRTSGCTVGVALDGQEGLEASRGTGEGPLPYDIVFSDIRMPRLDGLRMMQALRADPRTAALPLIAVSASSLEHQRRDYIEQGFDDFVSKPYAFEEIYAMLVQHAGVRLHPTDDGPADGGWTGIVRLAAPADATAVPAAATAVVAVTAAAAGSPAASPAPAAHGAAWRERLQALREAAADGALHAVRRGLQALEDGDLTAERRRLVETDLRQYDFDALDARLVAWLAEDGPDASVTAPSAAR